mmetsp:Transcript_5249/g.22332  ORF Transcript_5249/g.22332 Transcript_5249/m.22332 type:complete len:353 (-) Transcript_5249:133-1191(-)
MAASRWTRSMYPSGSCSTRSRPSTAAELALSVGRNGASDERDCSRRSRASRMRVSRWMASPRLSSSAVRAGMAADTGLIAGRKVQCGSRLLVARSRSTSCSCLTAVLRTRSRKVPWSSAVTRSSERLQSLGANAGWVASRTAWACSSRRRSAASCRCMKAWWARARRARSSAVGAGPAPPASPASGARPDSPSPPSPSLSKPRPEAPRDPPDCANSAISFTRDCRAAEAESRALWSAAPPAPSGRLPLAASASRWTRSASSLAWRRFRASWRSWRRFASPLSLSNTGTRVYTLALPMPAGTSFTRGANVHSSRPVGRGAALPEAVAWEAPRPPSGAAGSLVREMAEARAACM